MENKRLVIFTDLDGTLLHPRTYSFGPAAPALAEIREKNVPLILCSSKTRSEIELYRKRLGNRDPFICENGGAVFIPEGYFPFEVEGEKRDGYSVIVLGRPYSEIREIFTRVNRSGLIKGFGDMTAEEVSHLTGLPPSEASLALNREFDEPFIFMDRGADKDEFLNAIEASGLRWTSGKVHHAIGDNNKGMAVRILKTLFEKALGAIKTAGLGDGLNDMPMLMEVDRPVLIPKEDGSYEALLLPNLVRQTGAGPVGWNNAVKRLLTEFS